MRRPVPAYALDDGRPIAELNMTPLIDVVLVLIVMFILVVPPMTHAVSIDLSQGRAPAGAPPVRHRLTVARDGGLMLDGAGVSDAALARRLGALTAADPMTTLSLGIDPRTRYERADQVLATVKRAGVTRLGFEGLGRSRVSGSELTRIISDFRLLRRLTGVFRSLTISCIPSRAIWDSLY